MQSISILVAAFYAFLTQAIGYQCNSGKIFQVLEVMEGVSCISLSKNMTNAIDINLEDQNENFSGNLNQIRLVVYNPDKGKLPGNEFIQKATSLLPSPYRKFVDEEEADPAMEIWMKGRKNRFSEFHLFIKNENEHELQFVVSFYGEFCLNHVSKLKKTGKIISADVV